MNDDDMTDRLVRRERDDLHREATEAREAYDALVARIEALADDMESVPDYTASSYDQGRVDQRHMAVAELRAVLTSSGGGEPMTEATETPTYERETL